MPKYNGLWTNEQQEDDSYVLFWPKFTQVTPSDVSKSNTLTLKLISPSSVS